MSQPGQNQQVKSPSTTPKSNPPQPKTNKPARPGEPDAFARLAEAAANAQAYLNNPKAEKTSIRREPVRLVPDLNELPRPANQKHGSASSASFLPQTPPSREVQPGRGEDKVAGSASSGERTEGRGSSSTPPLATDSHASAKHEKDAVSPASSLPQAGFGNRGTGSQPVQDNPARSASSSSRATGHKPRATPHHPRAPRDSTVRQAKNYLRASGSPKFLRSAPNLQRHRRKCAICRHPEREMIEELFVRWHSPQAIANFLSDYDEINWVSIYRHAYALGLDQVRRRNLRHFFENLLDDAINATPTFAGVLGAARALGCVTEDGRWVEPEKHITMTTIVRKEEPASTTTSTEQEEPDVPLSASFRERTEGRGSSSTSRSLPAVAGASFQNRDFAETSGPVPPRQEEGVRVHAAHVGADCDRPGFDRPEFPMQAPAVRSGSREIRLPLNSHKTKHKRISNR